MTTVINDMKENKLVPCILYGVETLKWHKGASLIVDFIITHSPKIIRIDGVVPSLIYIQAIENLLINEIKKLSLKPFEHYRVEAINTRRINQKGFISFELKSIQKITSNILEKGI